MRPAHPWYRSGTNSWYVELNGKQQPLGRHPDGATPPKRGKGGWNPPADILKAFHKLMATEGDMPVAGETLLAVQVCDLFLQWSEKHSTPATFAWHKHFVASFCGHKGTGRVKVANDAAVGLKDFYSGLGIALATMLESPKFLFRQEIAEPDTEHSGQYRMDAWSKASQLSFFLWNAAPDPELLAAAEKGDLNSQSGLAKQVDRMVKSPRLASGVRAFFTDMLGFDGFTALQKDPQIYPKYGSAVAIDAQEQTLRTLADLLVAQNGDYRDIFTTRKTYLTRLLGSVYAVPVTVSTGWEAHEYPEGDPRAGILTEVSFVALHSHPGRSSPTIRGKALREIMLCQKVPDPPGNVNFTVVQDTGNPMYKTARDRLTAHRTNPACAGCHKLMDPMGLAMENFDSAGGYRTTENGVTIDASGEITGFSASRVAALKGSTTRPSRSH